MVSRRRGHAVVARMSYVSGVLVLALLVSAFPAGRAEAIPTGQILRDGGAWFEITGPVGSQVMKIHQSTNRAIITYYSFSIANGEAVKFLQPGTDSATLNRVLGPLPSDIAGVLEANGNVILCNPNGIHVGTTGVINVHGLIASTLPLSDSSFNSGEYHFQGVGGEGSVVNEGAITTATGGHVYLIGRGVANHGTISAPGGRVGLLSAADVHLSTSPSGLVLVSAASLVGTVENSGRITAEGGRVDLYGGVVNQTGLVDATKVVAGPNGEVTLVADGDVTATGQTRGDVVQLTSNTANIIVRGVTASEAAFLDAGGEIIDGGEPVKITKAGLAIAYAPDPAADIVAPLLGMLAGAGIAKDDMLEVDADQLGAVTQAGSIHITDVSGGVEIAEVTVGGKTASGVAILGGSPTDEIVIITNSPMRVGAGVTNTGGGRIMLAAQGASGGDDLTIDAPVSAAGGNGGVELNAGDGVTLTSSVSTQGSGGITIQGGHNYNSGSPQPGTPAADVILASGSLLSAEAGDININSSGRVSLQGDISTQGGVFINGVPLGGSPAAPPETAPAAGPSTAPPTAPLSRPGASVFLRDVTEDVAADTDDDEDDDEDDEDEDGEDQGEQDDGGK